MSTSAEDISYEAVFAKAVQSFWDDPYGFVLFIFPWGEKNTRLYKYDGPDKWQADVLKKVRDELKKGARMRDVMKRIRVAVRSGHGVGKTALVAWIILWFMCTRPDPQVVVTANTKQQLTTKTWRELAKWLEISFVSSWFRHSATQLKSVLRPDTWFATAIPWSESNSEAFAGTHEEHVLYLFDEASAIADIIWEVAEGAMTTEGAMWFAFGNPTKTTGRFSQCFKKFKKRWMTYEVDSRDAKMADIVQINEWIEDYGIDNDFVRVRVLGKEPSQGDNQFIGSKLVELAVERKIERRTIPSSTPRVMAWDISRGGQSKSVGVCRTGRKIIPEATKKVQGMKDLMILASIIADHINEWQPDLVVIDATGMGAGVFDRLIQLGYDNVIEFYGGDREGVLNKKVHYNRRIEVWDATRRWLKTADIPDDQELKEQLCEPEYYFRQDQSMILESKEDMAKRGVASPDYADAVSMTFAEPMPKKLGDSRDSDLEPEVE